MKHFFCISICLFLLSTVSFGQSQYDLNQEAYADYKKAEKEINAVYQKVIKMYSADTEFIKNLRTAQRFWIQFRDAEVKAKYPDRQDGYYGSMHLMCVSNYMTQLTNERTKTLKTWLIGLEVEGDACAGSIKVNQ